MKNKITLNKLIKDPSCLSEYDPNAISLNMANSCIEKILKPVQTIETVSLDNGLDRVLAENIISPINVPNYNNSAMDGFTFNIESLSTSNTLKISDTILAGNILKNSVKKGQAIKIMTGGKIPEQADTVIPIELVTQNKNSITFLEKPKKGANIRKLGEDIKKGKITLKRGVFIRPAEVGLIASIGINKIKVFKKIKVAFFSTGDEVVKAGKKIKSGQVYDSNHYTVQAMLKKLNVDSIDLGIIPDNKKLIKNTLIKASQKADAIITTGGVSVGQADYIKEILSKIGKVLFWKLSIKPGRPMAFGKFQDTPYFGLPGNPVAAMVTFYQIVQPGLKFLMGEKYYQMPPLLKAKCNKFIYKKPGRQEFQRGVLTKNEAEWVVEPTGSQGSAILSSMSQSNCFIVLGVKSSSVKNGEMVEVQIMNGLI
jgi:molybdopterin molybdotransferase